MAQPLAREALLSGLRLIQQAPLAVLVWWFVLVVEYYSEAWVYAKSGGSAAIGAFVSLAFEAFLISAMFRVLLRAGGPGLAWLRLGWAEGKMFIMLAVIGLICVLVAVPVSIAASYVFLFARWPGLGSVVLSIGLAATVLAMLRFSPLPAMLVDTGEINIRAAWNATRGHYWALAILALGLGLIEQGLSWGWEQLFPRLQTRVLSATLYDPNVPRPPPEIPPVSPWPSPLRLLEVAGDGLFSLVLLIFLCAVIATVWRASKQTVD